MWIAIVAVVLFFAALGLHGVRCRETDRDVEDLQSDDC